MVIDISGVTNSVIAEAKEKIRHFRPTAFNADHAPDRIVTAKVSEDLGIMLLKGQHRDAQEAKALVQCLLESSSESGYDIGSYVVCWVVDHFDRSIVAITNESPDRAGTEFNLHKLKLIDNSVSHTVTEIDYLDHGKFDFMSAIIREPGGVFRKGNKYYVMPKYFCQPHQAGFVKEKCPTFLLAFDASSLKFIEEIDIGKCLPEFHGSLRDIAVTSKNDSLVYLLLGSKVMQLDVNSLDKPAKLIDFDFNAVHSLAVSEDGSQLILYGAGLTDGDGLASGMRIVRCDLGEASFNVKEQERLFLDDDRSWNTEFPQHGLVQIKGEGQYLDIAGIGIHELNHDAYDPFAIVKNHRYTYQTVSLTPNAKFYAQLDNGIVKIISRCKL